MIVKDELRGQDRRAVRRSSMDRDVKASRVVFVPGNLHVLQEADELRDAPAELPRVGLHQDQLKNVDDEEATILGGVLHDDGAGD